MVFHPASARNVALEVAERILSALPPFVTPVGLFVDASAEQVMAIAGRLGLRHVQLHGRETPAVVTRVRATVIKAVRVDPGGFAEELGVWRRAIRECDLRHLRGLVLETAGDGAPGGTGVANDWATVRRGEGGRAVRRPAANDRRGWVDTGIGHSHSYATCGHGRWTSAAASSG